VLEQRERHRTRRDEEDENPDRPVIQPIRNLVALADAAIGGELDAARMAVHLLVGRRKNGSG
jgi:hypothetical protein